MDDEFCLKMPNFHVTFRDLLHSVNLRHRTNGFTSLPKEGVLKNPTVSAGFEPANLGTKCQHANSRPPKPLIQGIHIDDNCKYDYKFCKGSEGYISITGVVLNIHFERNAQFACMLQVQRNSYVFIRILRIILCIYM